MTLNGVPLCDNRLEVKLIVEVRGSYLRAHIIVQLRGERLDEGDEGALSYLQSWILDQKRECWYLPHSTYTLTTSALLSLQKCQASKARRREMRSRKNTRQEERLQSF